MELSVTSLECPLCGNTLYAEILFVKQYTDVFLHGTIAHKKYRYICRKCGEVNLKN